MTARLVGLDWSSKAIHAALIPLDPDHGDPDTPPVAFRMAELVGDDWITRCQSIPEALRHVLQPSGEIAHVEIEEQAGYSQRDLLPIMGGMVSTIRFLQPHCTVATLTAVEWRKQLGLGRITKDQAIAIAGDWLVGQREPRPADTSNHYAYDKWWPNEHLADALLLALAAREITWRAAA